MNESRQDYSGQTIAQLNEVRRELMLEVRELRKRQAGALDKVFQEVAKEQDQEDIAESYFSSSSDSGGKYFSQRLENCMRAMRNEVKKLEESVGAQLGEIEEELDSALIRLTSKEKELEILKNQTQGTAASSKEFKDFLTTLSHKFPDSSFAEIDDSKLQSLMTWRNRYESRLEDIILTRKDQLENQILSVSAIHGAFQESQPEQAAQKPLYKKIEHMCHSVNKVIDAQLQGQHQIMDAERDRLLKQNFMDQMTLHKSYVNKYNAIKAAHQEEDLLEKQKKGYHQNALRIQQQQSIHSVHASTHVTAVLPSSAEESGNSVLSVTNEAGSNQQQSHPEEKSWRVDLLESLEDSLARGATVLADAHDKHEYWLSSFSQPTDIPPMTMADLFAQQQLTLQSANSPTPHHRSSVSFFTDVEKTLEAAAYASQVQTEFSLPTVSTPNATAVSAANTNKSQHFFSSNTPDLSSPPQIFSSPTAAGHLALASSPEKLVSKHYEDIVLKLANVYQRYNDGRVASLVPQPIQEKKVSDNYQSPLPDSKNSYGGLLGVLEGKKGTPIKGDYGGSPYRNLHRKFY